MSAAAPAIVPLKLISRGLPSFVSSGTASLLNSSDYANPWQSSALPATATIDGSTVFGSITADGNGKKPLLVVFTNGFISYYSTSTSQTGNLTDYTIEVNAAASAGSAPTSGWVTRATVTGNIFAHRAHLIDVAGMNWVRVNCSQTNATTCKMDLYDASGAALADFSAVKAGHLFVGDSITEFGMACDPQGLPGSPLSVGDQVKSILGGAYQPFTLNAGMSGWDTTITGDFGWLKLDGPLSRFENAVATFPGLFVWICLFTNDANASISYADAYAHLQSFRTICLAYGKRMVIPTLPYSTQPAIEADRAAVSQAISDMLTNYPDVIAGEDRYAYGVAHPTQMNGAFHPDGDGYVGLRTLRATRIAAFGAGA